MPDFENFDVKSHITASAQETFETMLSMEISVSDEAPPEQSGENRMVGTLNFAGNIIGIINIQITNNFGYQMAASMLGIEPDEVESINEVKDLLAEITNIVGGNVKSALNDAGFPCVLSTPAITYGTDFTIKSLNMERYERHVFQHESDTIFIEVGLKSQEVSDDGAEFGATDITGRLQDVDIDKINELDYKARIVDAMVDVFDTMISLDLEPTDSISIDSLEGLRNMASVCFGGDATGIVNIQVSDEFSRIMAASMLGMESDEIEGLEEIVDLLGELSNIVGGSLKSALTDAGLACALSTPSFTTGTDFEIELLNLERYERFAFKYDIHTVFVEMGIKISDLAKVADQSAKEVHYDVTDSEPSPEPDGVFASPEDIVTSPPEDLIQDFPPDQPEESEADEPEEPVEAGEDFNLELLLDIPLEITVELGRTRMPIRDLLQIEPGSAVKLSRLEGEPVDILANDTLIAKGEVVVQNEKYGIRITEITSRMDRIRNLR